MSKDIAKIEFAPKRIKSSLREKQLNQATKVNFKNEENTLDAFSEIRKVKNPKSTALTLNSKLDEQDLFASLTYSGLKQVDENLAANYLNKLKLIYEKLSLEGKDNIMLKSAKRALYKLVKERKIVTGAAKILRRIIVGKSNLDGDVTSLLTKRVEGAKETPLRAVKTILTKVAENKRANEVEFREYSKSLK